MSARILIIESESGDRARMAKSVEGAGFEPVVCKTHHEATLLLQSATYDSCGAAGIDVIVTDFSDAPENQEIRLGEVLEWVETLRTLASRSPIVLIAREGAEAIAREALLRGAATYLPDRLIEEELGATVKQVLGVSQTCRAATKIDQCISRVKLEFVLPNQEGLVPSIIGRLEEATSELSLFDEMIWTQVAMALDESLLNAMIHGNLEVDSSLREVDDGQAYWDAIKKKRETDPYKDRRVYLTFTATRNQAIFVVRDQGPGFDLSAIPDPDDPANLEQIGGRGLLLINAFMDDVSHNDIGNELTMIKRRGTAEDIAGVDE